MLSIVRKLAKTAGAANVMIAAGCGSQVADSARVSANSEPTGPNATVGAAAGQEPNREASVAVAADACAAARGSTAPVDPDSVETIQPERRVPAFDVTTVDCRNFKSGDLVGKRPFVLVFFSSWCRVCDRKMPAVRAAAAALGNQIDFIGVALDEDETWENVPSFIERHGLAFPIVRGAAYRSFSLGYDPIGSIPVVVVVGRDGVVVDLQVGYSPFDYNRLVGAAALAEKVRPDAVPLPSPAP
jgi:thiol-disulfide isomerase/thioredoxin